MDTTQQKELRNSIYIYQSRLDSALKYSQKNSFFYDFFFFFYILFLFISQFGFLSLSHRLLFWTNDLLALLIYIYIFLFVHFNAIAGCVRHAIYRSYYSSFVLFIFIFPFLHLSWPRGFSEKELNNNQKKKGMERRIEWFRPSIARTFLLRRSHKSDDEHPNQIRPAQ